MKPGHRWYETKEQKLEKYGRCPECNQPNTYKKWCQSCNANHFREAFSTWSSDNAEIDYFIQNTQIHAWSLWLILEWYPWELFSEVEKIGQGGYGTVFRAKTKRTRIREWDYQNNQWSRDYDIVEYVALKTIGESESLSKDLLNEVIYNY